VTLPVVRVLRLPRFPQWADLSLRVKPLAVPRHRGVGLARDELARDRDQHIIKPGLLFAFIEPTFPPVAPPGMFTSRPASIAEPLTRNPTKVRPHQFGKRPLHFAVCRELTPPPEHTYRFWSLALRIRQLFFTQGPTVLPRVLP